MAQAQAKAPELETRENIVSINPHELRERVRALLLAETISQGQMARECGLSTSVVSQFLSGSYKGDVNKVSTAIVKWLNGRDESARINAVLPQAPAWIEMPTARRILETLMYAHHVGDITVVYGGAGLCKTSTIRRYVAINTNVWHVTATPATASTAVLLEEITIALGLHNLPPHPAKLLRAIIRQVTGTNGLLVIDEAQHLTKQALETARSIHDATGIGICFAGNASVYNNLFKGGNNGFAQLFSRVGKKLALVRPVAGDVHALAGAFKVTGTPERRELEAIGRRAGALRMVTKVLRLAAVFAGGSAITLDHIKAAYVDLQGEIVEVQEAAS